MTWFNANAPVLGTGVATYANRQTITEGSAEGAGNYNGLHFQTRKAYSNGIQFDFNYTWSKCEDLSSSPESSGSGSGFILNPFDQNQNKVKVNHAKVSPRANAR